MFNNIKIMLKKFFKQCNFRPVFNANTNFSTNFSVVSGRFLGVSGQRLRQHCLNCDFRVIFVNGGGLDPQSPAGTARYNRRLTIV
jgi:hypothetical protein